MSIEEVRESLQSVPQGTFPDSDEKTRRSIVSLPCALTADRYFCEDYEKQYSAMLPDKGDGCIFTTIEANSARSAAAQTYPDFAGEPWIYERGTASAARMVRRARHFTPGKPE